MIVLPVRSLQFVCVPGSELETEITSLYIDKLSSELVCGVADL